MLSVDAEAGPAGILVGDLWNQAVQGELAFFQSRVFDTWPRVICSYSVFFIFSQCNFWPLLLKLYNSSRYSVFFDVFKGHF